MHTICQSPSKSMRRATKKFIRLIKTNPFKSISMILEIIRRKIRSNSPNKESYRLKTFEIFIAFFIFTKRHKAKIFIAAESNSTIKTILIKRAKVSQPINFIRTLRGSSPQTNKRTSTLLPYLQKRWPSPATTARGNYVRDNCAIGR